jgi:hypothetical protein
VKSRQFTPREALESADEVLLNQTVAASEAFPCRASVVEMEDEEFFQSCRINREDMRSGLRNPGFDSKDCRAEMGTGFTVETAG